jgi:hypothetical protein
MWQDSINGFDFSGDIDSENDVETNKLCPHLLFGKK